MILGYGRVATLDILSASGLINYFGKWTDLTQIQISPILLQKGTSRLALYGLSYIKDERLSRLFRDRKASLVFKPETFFVVCIINHHKLSLQILKAENNFF